MGFAGYSVRDREKKKGGGGLPALAGTREYEQSDRNWLQAEGVLRCYGIWYVLWYVHLDGQSKNKELWSYVVSFELSRLKVAQIGPSRF